MAQLSKTQRELISRSAALFLGLALCYGSYKCFRWMYLLLNDPAVEETRSSRRTRTTSPLAIPVALGCILGLGGLAFTGFAILPTRVLYRINPMYNESEPEDYIGRLP